MKQASLIAMAVTGVLALTACNQPATNSQPAGTKAPAAAAPAAEKPENVVATINGKVINKESVAMMMSEIQQRRGPNAIAEDKVIDELISRELLKQEAEKENLAQDPANAARLANAQRIMLSQMAAEHYMKTAQVSDEEAKKEYEQRVAASAATEYKARHILVDSEAAAKDILAQLKKGAKFEDLAKKNSKDPGSKVKGGDLGWFNPQQMVPPFSEAVKALKNGETTAAPVQTQFGWHIIQREDSREQTPPPFDQVKDQIKNLVQSQKLQQHIEELKKNAKIDRPAPPPAKTEPTPAPATPAAATPPPAAEKGPDASLEAGKPEAAKQEEHAKPETAAKPAK